MKTHMGERLTAGLGIAAVFAGAMGLLAPAAAAQELAPGVSCDGFTCRNDTDDTYRVEGVAWCSDHTSMRFTRYIAPRVEAARVNVDCAPTVEPGTWEDQPPRFVPGTWKHQPPTIGPDGKIEHHPPVFEPGGWERQPPVFRPGRTLPNHVLSIEYRSAVVDNSPPPPASGSAGR
ncbi:hypothetical protein [Nocardia blacklockiae]|uniref:hypothetical protein n=1 Tax=Nocardia blacklockiae TaxID=480036 RepID=UPI0018958066|nr:hypothetical protein [Nocardia blacklockiae]MBF6173440.1 hypothetical protein [Nocardia blacklockiae]